MPLFNSSWLGINAMSAAFDGIKVGIASAFGVNAMEKRFLEQTKARFQPRGSNAVAQIGPDGRPWPGPARATLERRKKNRNAAQAMVDTGGLLDDIVVLGRRDVAYGGKGFIRIGLRPGSPAQEYMHVLEHGGFTPDRRPIPPRPVFGTDAQQAKQLAGSLTRRIIGGL